MLTVGDLEVEEDPVEEAEVILTVDELPLVVVVETAARFPMEDKEVH